MGRTQNIPEQDLEAFAAQAQHSPPGSIDKAHSRKFQGRVAPGCEKKIWIDIDNSPHVPFFIPIIEELQKRGHKVLLTARDSYQVCELLEFHHLECKVVGKHWGKNRIMKTLGTLGRATRLIPLAYQEKPDLAISLVSRAQLIACKILNIPMVVTFDYEFVETMQFLKPDWILVPEVIPDSASGMAKRGTFRYAGLKEDVYVPSFKPDASLRKTLGISESDLLVTVRPPATEAHYHNPESDELMIAALNFLTKQPDTRVVLLPRNEKQSSLLQKEWAELIAQGKIVIPSAVMDGLNLIWHSDLVISGGGTMNREAAALGIPVYSIFRGRMGAVDRYLEANGRLIFLERAEDIFNKIILQRREKACRELGAGSTALREISDAIISIAEHQCLPAQR
jgi:predicted glycosyltransferase